MLLASEAGRTLRSKDDTPPRVPAGPARRPFSRTRVRLAPRPRRSIVCAPGPPLVTKFDEMAAVIWVEPAAIGELCSVEAMSNLPSFAAIAGLMTEIGSGLLNGVTVRMRDPVTTIESSGAGVGAATLSSSCAASSVRAKAGVAPLTDTADRPAKQNGRSEEPTSELQ